MFYSETVHVLMVTEYHFSLVIVFHSFGQESVPGSRGAWIKHVVNPVLLRLTHSCSPSTEKYIIHKEKNWNWTSTIIDEIIFLWIIVLTLRALSIMF